MRRGTTADRTAQVLTNDGAASGRMRVIDALVVEAVRLVRQADDDARGNQPDSQGADQSDVA